MPRNTYLRGPARGLCGPVRAFSMDTNVLNLVTLTQLVFSAVAAEAVAITLFFIGRALLNRFKE